MSATVGYPRYPSAAGYARGRRAPRRRADWFLVLLLLGASACLPLVINATRWVPEALRLLYVAAWAALTGVILARTVLPTWLAWLVGLGLGVEYSIQFAGKLLPRFGLVWSDAGRALSWAWNLVARQTIGPELPFARSALHLWMQSRAMVAHLTEWIRAVQAGEPTTDNTALWLGVAFVIWVLTFNAGFELFRRRRTFVALMPLGAGVVVNVAFTEIGIAYVHTYLGITLLALVWANAERMRDVWERLGTDFSSELKRDAVVAGAIMATVIFVIAILTPYITYNRAVFFFWDLIKGTVQPFYQDLDKAFAGRNPVPKPTPGAKSLGIHNIAQGELGQDTVLLVKTSDPAPPPEEYLEVIGGGDISALVPKRYWRERTYDVYTGSGWDSSLRNELSRAQDQPWKEIAAPYTVLTQTYAVLLDNPQLAHAVNEPVVVVDHPYRVIYRGEGDLAALALAAEEYTVVSHVTRASAADLRQAEGEYPEDIRQRYLQLPAIPDRVRELAEQIVADAGATTRYDKARAIEAYIRSLAYDTELEPPPLDADFVDYFLFDAQRGYCDYSASALVVMLRAVGVAARYASGFNMGEYDYDLSAWVVRSTNAHAWTEVYFPGYGWIEFEPTPTQRLFSYDDAPAMTGAALPQAPAEEPFRVPIWGWGAMLGLAVLFVILWPPRWFQRKRTPRELVWRAYGSLASRARWLGLGPVDGQTPLEYTTALAYALERRFGPYDGLTRDIALIGQAYQRARYSPHEIALEEAYRAEGAWRRVGPKLWKGLWRKGAPEG